jgi:hypothetical protein
MQRFITKAMLCLMLVGAIQATAGGLDVADPPSFTVPPGRYSELVSVGLIHGEPGAELHYTLDGSIPGEPDNPGSFIYDGSIPVDSTTSLRARALLDGSQPSPIITGSYLLDPASSLPVVAVTSDPFNFWDPDSGIYALGDGDPDFPHHGANFYEDWERPAHFEYFEADGPRRVAADVGMKIHGGSSVSFPQKSLRMIASADYGASRLDYAFFPERELDSYKRLILRNSGQDFTKSHFRDALGHRIAASSGLERQAYEPALIYLNGMYWGIQNLRERVDKFYIEDHYGVPREAVLMVEGNCSPIYGSCLEWNVLRNLMEEEDLSDPEVYATAGALMEMANFAEYIVFETFFTNLDWPHHNNKRWRPSTPGGRWRWILFDLDNSLGTPLGADYNAIRYAMDDDDYPPLWSTLFLRRLTENPDFVALLANAYAEHLSSSFRSERTLGVLEELKEALEPEMPAHRARWDLPVDEWEEEVEIMREFLEDRPSYARSQLRQELNLGADYSLTLDISPAGAGSIAMSAIEVDEAWTGDLFLGTPVSLSARPAPGWVFGGWSDGSLPGDSSVVVTPAGDYQLTAHFLPGAGVPVVINEINYNSADEFDPGDWVELHNPGSEALNMSGWSFKDSENDHEFRMPLGTTIDPGGFLVLCENSVQFSTLFPEVDHLPQDIGFGFGGGGDHLRLFNAQGLLMDDVPYSDDPPWPPEPDGDGPTLELIWIQADNAQGINWGASEGHGSPGAPNSTLTSVGDPATALALRMAPPYPNPFNPSTRFRFSLSAPGRAKLGIFDITGREVARPLDAAVLAGWRELSWNAGDLPSGVYFARLEAGGEGLTRKLLLLK